MIGRVRASLAALALMAGCAGFAGLATTRAAASSAPAPEPESLPALFDGVASGSDLELGTIISTTDAYRTRHVTYRSGDLRISGVITIPKGKGPFPAVVINHGWSPPSTYVTGQGSDGFRDHFARAGFVALHTDYRSHADSDDVGQIDEDLRIGYTRDVIAAVKALRDQPFVRDRHVALFGWSMGGGVTFNALVAEPGLVDAAVVWASISTDYSDLFERWTARLWPSVATAIVDRWGTVEDNPRFWADLSARTYFDRIDVPVLMHHGTADTLCPYVWAKETRAGLRDAGVDVKLHTYPGEGHVITRSFDLSMKRTVDFLRSEMGA